MYDGPTFNSDGLSIKGTYTKSYSDGKENYRIWKKE